MTNYIEDQLIEMSEDEEEMMLVLEFVKENTKQFDASHDYDHALKVARNAIKICQQTDVIYLALLHDVCDHKYPESIPRKKLSNWVINNLPEYKYIDYLIDKVSFSYHKRNLKEKLPSSHQFILDIVRDADRGAEALGYRGIQRLELYSVRIGRSEEDCIKHCFDKLLRLIPEGYIKNVTKEYIDNHNIIVDYVNQNSTYIVPYLKYHSCSLSI
jgi:HD superfamily phosphodiesterase